MRELLQLIVEGHFGPTEGVAWWMDANKILFWIEEALELGHEHRVRVDLGLARKQVDIVVVIREVLNRGITKVSKGYVHSGEYKITDQAGEEALHARLQHINPNAFGIDADHPPVPMKGAASPSGGMRRPVSTSSHRLGGRDIPIIGAASALDKYRRGAGKRRRRKKTRRKGTSSPMPEEAAAPLTPQDMSPPLRKKRPTPPLREPRSMQPRSMLDTLSSRINQAENYDPAAGPEASLTSPRRDVRKTPPPQTPPREIKQTPPREIKQTPPPQNVQEILPSRGNQADTTHWAARPEEPRPKPESSQVKATIQQGDPLLVLLPLDDPAKLRSCLSIQKRRLWITVAQEDQLSAGKSLQIILQLPDGTVLQLSGRASKSSGQKTMLAVDHLFEPDLQTLEHLLEDL